MSPHPRPQRQLLGIASAALLLTLGGCYVSNAELEARREEAQLRSDSIAEAKKVAESLEQTVQQLAEISADVRRSAQETRAALESIRRIAAAIPEGAIGELDPMSLTPGEGGEMVGDLPEEDGGSKQIVGRFAKPTPTLEEIGVDLSKVSAPSQGADSSRPWKKDTKWMNGKLTLMVEPLSPIPPLEKLQADNEWTEKPVLDAIELLRARLAEEPKLVSVQEALNMRNTSAETNAAILSALGRLPESEADVNYDASIQRHMGGDIKSTNPLLASSTYEFEVNSLTGFGIFAFDEDFTPFASADAAVSWKTSEDGLYDVVILRDDLLWSDGTPITAHDVEFSYKAIMTREVPVPAVRSGTEEMRWVHAYDDRTVVYFHAEPLATNVWNLNFPIIPKHAYEKTIGDDPTLVTSDANRKLDNNPVSGGPYKLVSRTVGQEVRLERNELYYIVNGKPVRDKPYFKTIRMRVVPDSTTALLALKSGELDEMQLQPEQWKSQTNDAEFYKRNTKATGLAWDLYYIAWNLAREPFSDVRVRQAMGHLIDYQEMLENKLQGLYQQSNGIFHPTAWMAHRPALPVYQQDLDKAVELLNAAGWKDTDGDGYLDKVIDGKKTTFQFDLMCPQDPLRVAMAEQFKQDFDRVGIRTIIKVSEFAALLEALRSRNFDACLLGLGTGADPSTGQNIWGTGAERNSGNYSNPDVDKLYALGQREFDREKRAAIYAHIQRLIYEDQPYTFLFVRNSFWGFNKSIRGLRFSPRGPFSYSPGFGSLWRPSER
jgi:peptide/nickel transport system substrate-binding protein